MHGIAKRVRRASPHSVVSGTGIDEGPPGDRHETRSVWPVITLVSALLGALCLAGSVSAATPTSSIYVQCPATTDLHPTGDGIKCRHLMAGDGMVTMASDDGKPLYVFSFADVGLPGQDGAPLSEVEYPAYVMEKGVLAANAPAPTIVVDEDDEFFLSLTNVGMAMRADLFDPHTVHWHGFPNAASIFDGLPDASVSINMGATLTYYYLAKDAGTYMYHCHVEATEHMQMGMLGNLYVRPRQNRCLDDASIPCPPGHATGDTYAYNDGDGSTRYDVEVPIQIGSFDPDFHDASLDVQPLPFAGMRDRYFLLNGRGYPDTVNPDPLVTEDPLGTMQTSQPVSSLIQATSGQRILLRISNLNVTRFYTLASTLPMQVVGLDARLLRDGDENNMYYTTNSVTLGGGQSADVIIDTTGLAPNSTYLLYSTNLETLANFNENLGGMMTEIRIN
jgi:FtsP/CotA-like multicopper oxidase with cupredoxin domain